MGVPARVVQDLSEPGPREYTDTVNTLAEALAFGRQLDRKEELELARLPNLLMALQQKNKAQRQQKLMGEHLPDGDPNNHTPASGRRGSEPQRRYESFLYRSDTVAGIAIGAVLLALFLGILGFSLGSKRISQILDSEPIQFQLF